MKKFLLVIFCLIILLSFIRAEENKNNDTTNEQNNKLRDPDFDDIPAMRIKNMMGLEKLLNETDVTFFAYYYKKSSGNSRKGAEFLKTISQKILYLVHIVMIDCDEIEPRDTPMCIKDPEAADGFPKMEVYVPPEYRVNPYTKQVNKHIRSLYDTQKVSEQLLFTFITKNIPSRSVKLNVENFESFVTHMDYNKVILFTDKPKTPLLFRGLSTYFSGRLLFGEVNKEEEVLFKKFKITRLPTLIVYQTHEDEIPLDEHKIEIYTGPSSAVQIVDFIGPYALSQALNNQLDQNSNNAEKNKYKVAFKHFKQNEVLLYMKKFSEKRFVVYANNQNEIPTDIINFNKMANGYFHFININCKSDSQTEKYCLDTFKIDEIPSLIMYKNTNLAVEDKLAKGGVVLPLDYLGIEREMYKEFYGGLKEANPQTFSSLIQETKLNKKVPFIYLHEGDIPLGLFLVSMEAKYKKLVDFIVYENPKKEFLHSVQVKQLPKLIILIYSDDNVDSAKVMTYNEELVYSRLGTFVNQFFNNERKTKISQEDEILEKKDISYINDKEGLIKNCLKNKKKICIFGLLDGRTNPNSLKQFDNSIKILENVELETRRKAKQINFGWLNATCQTELTTNLNINLESLPNLVAYVPSKKVFANLIGTFDEDTIMSFIDRTIHGKVALNPISSEKFVFQDIQCESLKETTENLDEDDILKEIIVEERKKRAEFEKERENLNEGEKKKKKKKKKDL